MEFKSLLYQSLMIDTVDRLPGIWTRPNMLKNLRGGSYSPQGSARDKLMSDIIESLEERRNYIVDIQGDLEDLEHKNKQLAPYLRSKNFFWKYFRNEHGQPHVVDGSREYYAFFHLLATHEDVESIARSSSSHLKASYLLAQFFMPSFLHSGEFQLDANMPWKFPLVVATTGKPDRKTRPRSDFVIESHEHSCPFIVGKVQDVISWDSNKDDRWDLLIPAIAAARVLQNLKASSSITVPLWVTAIYFTHHLIAQCYIIMQTGPNNQVSIAQTNYNLLKPEEAIKFLQVMFNLKDKLSEMERALDLFKSSLLMVVDMDSPNLPSLSTQKSTHTSQPMDEGFTEAESFMEDPDIIEQIDRIGCKLEKAIFGFNCIIAMICHKEDNSDHRFLKPTSHGQEVQILQYLVKPNVPDNHTIAGVEVWKRSLGGYVIHTFSGGDHVTSLQQPDKHIWSAAMQLVEGVAFMHKHGVAHRDIKPSNVVIPSEGGHLSIIDYGSAIFINGPETKSQGVVGTTGYMAPEVIGAQEYVVLYTDLWSCGKILEELAHLCSPSTQVEFILDMSQELMSTNPLQRPSMSEILEHMVNFGQDL